MKDRDNTRLGTGRSQALKLLDGVARDALGAEFGPAHHLFLQMTLGPEQLSIDALLPAHRSDRQMVQRRQHGAHGHGDAVAVVPGTVSYTHLRAHETRHDL